MVRPGGGFAIALVGLARVSPSMFDRDGWPLPASGKASPPSIGGRMRGGRASTATMPLREKSLVALALGADPRLRERERARSTSRGAPARAAGAESAGSPPGGGGRGVG